MLGQNHHARTILFIALVTIAYASGALAQIGGRDTKDWIKNLDRPERIAGLKVDQVISLLKLKPGDTVADIGAGAGAFSLPFAKTVAPSGRVYAVDIDDGLLEYIGQKAKKENLTNV